MLPVGPYRPDVAASNANVSPYVLNVTMKADEAGLAYGPHPSLSVTSGAGALPARPRGGCKVVLQSGTKKLFVGTAATVQEMANDFTWTSITTGKAVPSTDNWSMVQFGNKLLMTNTADGLFAYDVETPAGVGAVSGAPKFRYIFIAFDCLFGLNSDGDNRLFRNSAPNDYTNWSTGGAGYQPLADGEDLMAGGELSQGLAAVIQRKAVHLLTRTGDRRIFSRDKIAEGVGATNPWGCVFANGAGYFIDTDGFKRVTGGGIEEIGRDKVSRTFIESMVGSLDTVEGVHDRKRGRIVWRYQEKVNNSDTVFEKLIAYDLRLGEFAPFEAQTTGLFAAALPGYTADTASSVGDTDTSPYGPDSRFWVGGEEGLLGVNSSFKAGFFEGTNLAATLQTGTFVSETADLVRRVTPFTDATDATVQVGVRETLADAITWGTAHDRETGTSWCYARSRGKCKSARLAIPSGSDWSYARGVDFVDISAGGRR